MSEPELSEDERHEIFRLIVAAKDMDEVRKMIAEVHNLTDTEVSEIEQEGLRAGW